MSIPILLINNPIVDLIDLTRPISMLELIDFMNDRTLNLEASLSSLIYDIPPYQVQGEKFVEVS
jgi:hypothetical protein